MKKLVLNWVIAGMAQIFILSCTSNDINPPVDCSAEGPSLQLVEIGDADCNQENGFIEVAATGGTGSYLFKLGNGTFQSDPKFSDLKAGTYVITLKDENPCEKTMTINVQNKNGVNLILTSTASGCDSGEGSITVETAGGEEPFLYKIGSGDFQESHIFENLTRSSYDVTVKDNTGCEAHKTIKVLSGLSYEEDIKPIIETSCAINNCHNGHQFPDFRQFSNVQANASNIKKLTGNKTMPAEGVLTQNQINAIACWVDDGAPAN